MSVIATGSIAFDYILTFKGKFADHILAEKTRVINLSFLVDSVVKRRGGVAANYAYTLSLLGYPAAIVATAGADGSEYRAWLEEKGIDCSGLRILPDEQTATGYTTTDLDDGQITGYFGGAMLKAGSVGLDDTDATPEVVIIGPNAPEAMFRLVRECRERGIPWVWDPAHQLPHMNRSDLEEGCRGAWMVIGNDYELELIRQRTTRDVPGLLLLAEMVVTTFGRDGSTISTRDGEFFVPAAPAGVEVDPVGAGDAYRAGLVFGLLTGRTIVEAGRIASVAAAYVVEQKGTVEHSYSQDEFQKRYQDAYHEPLSTSKGRKLAQGR
ncbi:MAG TPA: carbohydrate kinase family protein [Chloroflexi bacterium]|jgi:adenosine kinase|nr:carbohydrate kinase family protein [Chloroflexota bacterium]